MCGRHINSFSCFCNVCKPDKPLSSPLPSPLPLQDVHGCTVWSVHCSGPVHGHGALLFNSLLWLHPGHRVSHSCRQHSNSQTVVCVGVWAQSEGGGYHVQLSIYVLSANMFSSMGSASTFCSLCVCGGGGGGG